MYCRALKTDSDFTLSSGHTLEILLGALVLIAPYYWIPGLSVGILSALKGCLVGVLTLLWGSRVVIFGKYRIFNPSVMVALSILPLVVLPGLIKMESISGFTNYLDYFLVIVVFLIANDVIYFRGIRSIERFYLLIILSMLPQALYVFAVVLGLLKPIPVPTVFRNPSEPYGVGFSAVQTQFSITLGLIVPLLAGYVFGNFEHRKRRQRYGFALLFLPLAVAMVSSSGRTGMLVALTGLFVFLILEDKRLFATVFTGLTSMLLFLLLVVPQSFFRITKINRGLNGFTSNRVYLFSHAWNIVLQNPVIGLGYGNRPFAIDNLYLATFVESGVLSGLGVAVILLITIIEGFRTVLDLRGTKYNSMAYGLFGAVVSYVPASMFERGVVFLNFYINVSWWVCLACLLALTRYAGDGR